jgi:hypothetical protein
MAVRQGHKTLALLVCVRAAISPEGFSITVQVSLERMWKEAAVA